MKKFMATKKAEMGIGTLIIFIALLLVAAVAAGVLIQTSGSLQERALTTGDQAKGQIATNVRVVEVSATDGSDGDLEYFEQIIKLSPGSNAIKLSQSLLTMNTYDATAILQYRNGTNEFDLNNGFYTSTSSNTLPSPIGYQVGNQVNLTADYDVDGSTDYVYWTTTDYYLFFNFSSGDTLTVSDFNCSAIADHDVSGTYTITGDDQISRLVVTGTCNSTTLNNMSIVATLKQGGEGYFTVEYLQRGTNPVDGNLQTGDVIKLFYAAPRDVQEDENIRLNFIPKIGTPTLTEFITPEVVSTERVYLYP